MTLSEPARQTDDWPAIRNAGIDRMLVSFGARLSEPANRAALAFGAAVERENWTWVEECATSLVSACLCFDPLGVSHETVRAHLSRLLQTRDWYAAPLPGGRRFWRIPTVYDPALAPQLPEAAAAAGLTRGQAVQALSRTRVRVQAIGFAPGQPYLGELDPDWDIPRQRTLTDRVPEGALTVAIRQLVLFAVSAPTGWRHVGQTAFRPFRPEADDPFVLRPGDEVLFERTDREKLSAMQEDPDGGAIAAAIP